MADLNERFECMHYIHNWYYESESKETIVPLHTMEKFIMSTLGSNLSSLTKDPQNPEQFKPFYHDFMESDNNGRQFANKQSFMNHTRLSVRRVLGCGHFILCVVYATYNQLESKYGDKWENATFWRAKKKRLLEEKLLDPEQPCNSEAVFKWFHDFYQELLLGCIPMDKFWDNAKIPFSMLRFKAPCDPDADIKSKPFMWNYQEFVIFLVHNLHDLGLLDGDPLLQYLRLVRRRGDPPATQLSFSQKVGVMNRIAEDVDDDVKR